MLLGKDMAKLDLLLLMGAAEYLLSLGADMNVHWDQTIANTPVPHLSYWQRVPQKRATRFFAKRINLMRPNHAVDTWTHGRLSLLHLAASINHLSSS